MNKWHITGLAFLLVAAQGYAQKNIPSALQRALIKETAVPATVPNLSKLRNQAAYQKLKGLFAPLQLDKVQAAHASFSPQQYRQVFKVKRGPTGCSSASAFALEIDGRVWGVTAAHVMENIQPLPYMVVTNPQGKVLSAPITLQYTGNSYGLDVAIFEIPSQLRPHIDVFKPAPTLQVHTFTQSPCFVEGIPFYLPSEEVLFSGPHRILLRDQAFRNITGYCGSPVLTQGKVAAIHIGSYSSRDVYLSSWAGLLQKVATQTPPPLHVAIPVQAAVQLARNITQDSGAGTDTPLYVLGKQVGTLSAQEYIFSVQQLRQGNVQKTWHAHPFMDFNKLEEFFELQEEDILRITVISPRTMTSKKAIRFYDVNVSTGEVTFPLNTF